MNNKHLRLGGIVVLLVMMLIQVGAVWAASVSVNISGDFLTRGNVCDFGTSFTFTYSGVSDSLIFRRSYIADGILEDQFQSVYFSASGSGGSWYGYDFGYLPETCGVLYEIIADGEVIYTKVWGDVPGYESNGPWFYTQPSAGELATSNHQSVLYNGAEACGVFEAGWYGRKYLTSENFPACAEYLPDGVEVVCMNEEAIWTADNVTGSGVSEGVFYAVVEQHGTCGIFPAG